jgi:bacterioferritin
MLTRNHAASMADKSLRDMRQEDLVAERIAMERERARMQDGGNDDPRTRRLREITVAVEDEPAEEVGTLRGQSDGSWDGVGRPPCGP